MDAGRLKALGISCARALGDLCPDMPTIAESGLPGFESWNYFGIFAPAGTPQAVVERVNAEMNRILRDPAIKERFHSSASRSPAARPPSSPR